MDLSGIIFVVLAVGWAAYLIPMLLKHHDDRSMSRPVETFSDSVRVVTAARTTRTQVATGSVVETGTTTEVVGVELVEAEAPSPVAGSPVVEPVEPVETPTHTITRAAARRAARRRRRVLVVLLLALVAAGVASLLAYAPVWAPAIPGVLVVAFLVVARLTVRAQQVRRAAPVQLPAAPAESVESVATSRAPGPAEVEPDLGREDTQGLSRDELADVVAAPVLDEGGLWDPLPVTLPTYVNKARARRTVRTIEITGITSSGHDAADTELARAAEEVEQAEASADSDAQADERKAAGA